MTIIKGPSVQSAGDGPAFSADVLRVSGSGSFTGFVSAVSHRGDMGDCDGGVVFEPELT